jgi:hypothetical protein
MDFFSAFGRIPQTPRERRLRLLFFSAMIIVGVVICVLSAQRRSGDDFPKRRFSES